MSDAGNRLPHAALDLEGRMPKAEKIRQLLTLSADRPVRLLEIGTGSGAIAYYFSQRAGLSCEAHAVDVLDQRQIEDGYAFRLVDGVQLPYADETFDVVISNHVIEHVGARDAQRTHIEEIARVLRPGGQAYLATPSRWQLVEPHFHVAFLSWLPRNWRTPYLRWRDKGDVYDCDPLAMAEVEDLLRRGHLEFRNAFVAALQMMLRTEAKPSRLLRGVSALPTGILELLRHMSPTHIYLLEKPVLTT